MSFAGTWNCTMNTPMGQQTLQIILAVTGEQLTGKLHAPIGEADVKDGRIHGVQATWKCMVKKPMAMTLEFDAKIDDDVLSGNVKLGFLGKAAFTGTRA